MRGEEGKGEEGWGEEGWGGERRSGEGRGWREGAPSIFCAHGPLTTLTRPCVGMEAQTVLVL